MFLMTPASASRFSEISGDTSPSVFSTSTPLMSWKQRRALSIGFTSSATRLGERGAGVGGVSARRAAGNLHVARERASCGPPVVRRPLSAARRPGASAR